MCWSPKCSRWNIIRETYATEIEAIGLVETQEMIGHVTQTIKEEVSGLLVSYLL